MAGPPDEEVVDLTTWSGALRRSACSSKSSMLDSVSVTTHITCGVLPEQSFPTISDADKSAELRAACIFFIFYVCCVES